MKERQRNSDAVYPRTKGVSEQHREGLVLSSTLFRDAKTRKYWCYPVRQTRRVDVCWNKLLLQIRQSQCNVSSTRSKSVAINADWSTLPFLICKFIQEVLGIDINLSAQLKISVKYFVQQVFKTHTRNTISPGKEMIMWTGRQMLLRVTSKQLWSWHQKPKTFKEFETHACIWILLERACIYICIRVSI